MVLALPVPMGNIEHAIKVEGFRQKHNTNATIKRAYKCVTYHCVV